MTSTRFAPFGLAPWATLAPVVALAALLLGKPESAASALLLAVVLGAAVMAAVYHAETLAHYLGEPFGTLTLAFAVTVIECSLIVSIMLSEGDGARTLARDTLMAAIMITINAIVGVCLLAGGGRHHVQAYTRMGVSIGLAMLAMLAVLTLVLPNFTVSARGPFYTPWQLGFVAVISLVLYATFVVAQTIRHREEFLHDAGEDLGHEPIPRAKAIAAGVAMIPALVAVVLLAKALSPTIEAGVAALGAPKALVGIVIAAVVLLPEGFAAFNAARANRIQTSLNLAIGSALATIGLTIPAVAIAALGIGLHLELGLSPQLIVMLALTLFVAALTLSTGRTTVVHGIIHLTIFATYLFITLVP